MSKTGQLDFLKVAGAGNDFVLVDTRKKGNAVSLYRKRTVQRLCDRTRGVGADGLLLLERSKVADVRMRIINADGSEAEMCGNGARCVLRYINAVEPRRKTIRMETGAGVLEGTVGPKNVQIQMPKPVDLDPNLSVAVERETFKGGFVNTGVPHFVVPVKNLEAFDVQKHGAALRFHKAFAPKGANVNFIARHERVASRIRVRTYERGVEAETLACGTGVAASAIIAALQDVPSPMMATFKKKFSLSAQPTSGDIIKIRFTLEVVEGVPAIHAVSMEGGAEIVFKGTLTL